MILSAALDKTSAAVKPGETVKLTATVAPAEASNKAVTWNSSDEAVATVADGTVTGVAEGTATITVTTSDGNHTATCTVTVSAETTYGGQWEEHSVTVPVEVIGASLPEQKLIHTEWFYCDCIADYYHVTPWSEEHWKLVEGQVRTAAKYGVNMLLTPIFTPALDTAVGHERTTVQLVDVTRENGEYSFGFEKLERWVKLCLSCGIKYFEMAHLYTQ